MRAKGAAGPDHPAPYSPEGVPVLAKPFLLSDLEAQLQRLRSSD